MVGAGGIDRSYPVRAHLAPLPALIFGYAHVGGTSKWYEASKVFAIVCTPPGNEAHYGYVDVDPSFSTMEIGMHTNVNRRNSLMMTVGPAAALEAMVVALAYNASPVSNKVNQNDMHFPMRAVLHI